MFNCEQTSALARGFDLAWSALQFAFPEGHQSERARDARQRLATAVIAVSRQADFDARRICALALREMPPYEMRREG
jgi:hypothetical protein